MKTNGLYFLCPECGWKVPVSNYTEMMLEHLPPRVWSDHFTAMAGCRNHRLRLAVQPEKDPLKPGKLVTSAGFVPGLSVRIARCTLRAVIPGTSGMLVRPMDGGWVVRIEADQPPAAPCEVWCETQDLELLPAAA